MESWHGRPFGHVLDIGCGAGFHLPRWAERGTRVTGVEPHPPLVEAARARVALLPEGHAPVEIVAAGAQELPVTDASRASAQRSSRGRSARGGAGTVTRRSIAAAYSSGR